MPETTNLGRYLPSSYYNNGQLTTSASTAQQVATVVQTDAQTLTPAAQSIFLQMVQTSTVLAPGADGAPPADLNAALTRMENAAETLADCMDAAQGPAALAALLIEATYAAQRSAVQQAQDASQMQIAEAYLQAQADTDGASTLQSSALQGLILSAVASAVEVVGAGAAVVGAGAALGELSELETGLNEAEGETSTIENTVDDVSLGDEGDAGPRVDTDSLGIKIKADDGDDGAGAGGVDGKDEPGSAPDAPAPPPPPKPPVEGTNDDANAGGDGEDEPEAPSNDSDAPAPPKPVVDDSTDGAGAGGAGGKGGKDESIDDALKDGEEHLLKQNRFQIGLKRIEAKNTLFNAINQLGSGAGHGLSAGATYVTTMGQVDNQNFQAQGQRDAANVQYQTQFYNTSVGVLTSLQSFVDAEQQAISGILQSEASEGGSVTSARANV